MSMEYIRKAYGVPAKRGGKVLMNFGLAWVNSTITSADNALVVRPDMHKNKRLRYHPQDENLKYLDSK